MKRFILISLTVLIALLGACGSPGENPSAPQTGTPLDELPTPVVRVTSAPDPQSGLLNFVEALKAGDYVAMYAMTSSQSQQSISEEDFIKRYRNAMNEMAMGDVQTEILSTTLNPSSAQYNVRVTYTSNVVGEITREIPFGFVLENGNWKISWEEGLILPELRGGNSLSMDYTNPARGNIYDRNGNVLVNQTQAVAMYVIPGEILPEQEATLLTELSNLTGRNRQEIQNLYAFAGGDWYVAIGEASLEDVNRRYGVLASLSGLRLVDYNSRFYYNSGIGAQAVGYVSSIPAEQFDQYLRDGYARNALVGQSGIESWAEDYLAGKSGGTLYVISPDGGVVSFLGKTEPQTASDIYLTIDRNLQIQTERALGNFRGAIVVIESDSGRILAMASSPDFDPNLFNPQNPNSLYGLGNVVNDAERPLVNRATQGQYPLGSVFKIITMAAALESGTFTPENTYECGYEYTELTGRTLYDWTWERFQREFAETGEGITRPSGNLTLSEGLMRSCNPWFYHLGYDLYRQGRTTAIADMARGFGLGSITGLQQLPEVPGNISNPPVPSGEVEAVNQAIGQGDMQVTPLQVANFIAAVGNGGTLYRPQLVEKVVDINGIETTIFKPEARSTLPVSEETLIAIQEAMRSVIANPRGTASHRFRNITTPVYGKTGTAQTGNGLPHSWFAGYTQVIDGSVPNISIAVIVENQGDGSEYAAPIFRRVLEIYYTGRPQSVYWWEASIGNPKTPTPIGGIPTETDNDNED